MAATIGALVAGFLIELACGADDRSVSNGLCALAGITYGMALAC